MPASVCACMCVTNLIQAKCYTDESAGAEDKPRVKQHHNSLGNVRVNI